ncbi:MAG: hypothetical protein ACK5TU_17585 [Cyclobacteriaceae bacterium]|jgi:hypothetical protein
MRHIAILIFTLWTRICLATGQSGELVIYKGDTLTMLSEPLEIYLRNNEPRQRFHPFLENGCSTALWRGYVGLWRIQNGKLLLVDVYVCGDRTQSIKRMIFKNQNGEIPADWFTGDLFIERGKMIKYNHSGYDRYFETEVVANVNEGNIETEKEYKNGVRPDDQRFTSDIKKIVEEIHRRINWDRIPKLSNDKRVFANLILDNGKLVTVDSTIEKQNIESVYKMEVKRIIADFPAVQVFYSRGQPLREGYYGAIIFSRQNKKRYAR